LAARWDAVFEKRLKFAATSLKLAAFGLFVGRRNPANSNYAIFSFPVKGHARCRANICADLGDSLRRIWKIEVWAV